MATERDVHDAQAVDEAARVDHDSVESRSAATEAGHEGGPQDEEDMAAAEGLKASPETKRNYEEMLERGAHQKGEGRVP